MPVAGMQSPLKVEQRDPRDPMDHLRQRAQKEAWYLRPEVLAHPAPELLWPGNRSAEHQGYAQPKREITMYNVLGEGDCAIVYRARWRGLDAVAKMLKSTSEYKDDRREDMARADLMHEISVISHLRHPNLVLFLGACMGDHGGMILLSEFMEGGTLEDFFHKRARASASKPSQRLAPAAVFRWMQDLSQALCFLHNCSPPIIHRDLKPANILLGTEGRLKVGDLGLSSVLAREHAVSAAGPGRTSYMMTGKTGTLRYMAPEVLNVNERGQSVYDDKVDIYSASMVMWFMCMGERPFGNLDSDLLVMGTIKGLRPDLSSIRRKYGGFVADIISRCWAGNPEDRYTAEELVNVIQVAREAIATGAAMPGGIPQEKKSGTKLGRRFARATSWLSSRFLSSKKEQSDRRGSFRKKAQAESASSDAPPSPQAGAANGDWPSAEFSRTQSPTEGGRSAHGWRGWDQPSRRVHSERPAAWRESYLDWDRPGVVWGSSFDQSSLSELLDLTVKSAPGGDWFGSGALGYAAMPPHRSLGTGSDSESGHSCRGSGRHSPSTSGRHSPSTSIGNSGSLPRSGSFQRQSVDSKRSTIAGPSPFTQSVENGIATALLAGAGPVAHGESSPPSTAEGQTRAGKLQATAPHLGRTSLSTESADGFDASKGIFKMDAV